MVPGAINGCPSSSSVSPCYTIIEPSLSADRIYIYVVSRFLLQKYHPLSDTVLGTYSVLSFFQSLNLKIDQYSLFNDYSGQVVYESWTWSFYNVVFTILPPLVIGIFDQFVSARMLDRYPQLYQLGQSNSFFTPIAFWQWIGNAFYHSAVGPLPHCQLDLWRVSYIVPSIAAIHFLSLRVLGRSEAK